MQTQHLINTFCAALPHARAKSETFLQRCLLYAFIITWANVITDRKKSFRDPEGSESA